MKLSFLLFVQVVCTANAAVVASNKEGEHSLRGGESITAATTANGRSLFDVMDLGPNESNCALHESMDGTYVCAVRSSGKVSDVSSSSENHLACVTSADGQHQKCANIGLSDGPGPAASGGGTSTGTSTGTDGFPTQEEQDTPGGDASDQPPAEDGNYDSEDTLPTNTAQLCVTNGVGATCPAGAGLPDIACCTSGVTGSFFNACCPSDFAGIQMGTGATDTNEFIMDILTGTDVLQPADCVVNANKEGCQIFDVPGNEPGKPLNLPAGVDGPCVEIASGGSCSTTQGTCTAAGRTFPVCCPKCATGTYLPGQSCAVTLPDPAACGDGVSGSGSSTSGPSDPVAVDPIKTRPDHDGGLMPNQGGGVKCPKNEPSLGGHCCAWIPTGSIEASCLYDSGTRQCNCASQDDDCTSIGWSCRNI